MKLYNFQWLCNTKNTDYCAKQRVTNFICCRYYTRYNVWVSEFTIFALYSHFFYWQHCRHIFSIIKIFVQSNCRHSYWKVGDGWAGFKKNYWIIWWRLKWWTNFFPLIKIQLLNYKLTNKGRVNEKLLYILIVETYSAESM